MKNNNTCPVCSATLDSDLLFYKDFPYFSVPVDESNRKAILKQYDLEQLVAPLAVKTCNHCTHCYLGTLPDQKIIDFLYAHCYSYPSPLEGNFRPERDDRFLQFFQEKISSLCEEQQLNTVLEVGCFDGYILYHLQQKGFIVTGCDPSDGAEIGKAHGLNIHREFFNPETFLKKTETFDIVISRHFIEHLIHPGEWVENLAKILSSKGILVVETPNIEFYLEKGLLEAFSLQHLQGFTSISLEYLLNKEGMRVIQIEETPNNLIVVAEKDVVTNKTKINSWQEVVAHFEIQLQKNKAKLREIISPFINNHKTIGLWGAGGFGLAALLLYEIPFQPLSFIIDSDKQKWDMQYLNYSIPIISPEAAKEKQPDLIVITSMYSESILQQIQRLNYRTHVLTVFPEVVYSDLTEPT